MCVVTEPLEEGARDLPIVALGSISGWGKTQGLEALSPHAGTRASPAAPPCGVWRLRGPAGAAESGPRLFGVPRPRLKRRQPSHL